MKSMQAKLGKGDSVADFGNGLKFKSNKPASSDYLITVEAVTESKTLSILEHRVVCMWCKEWADQRGSTQESCRNEFKARFLFPLIAHKPKHSAVKQLLSDIWKRVRADIRYDAVGPHIRSEWANHDEYHEALTQFELWATTEAGITLTEPDKYRAAREKAISTGKTTRVKS